MPALHFQILKNACYAEAQGQFYLFVRISILKCYGHVAFHYFTFAIHLHEWLLSLVAE
jgi:hypothetical protein